jgi:hypothetical protein
MVNWTASKCGTGKGENGGAQRRTQMRDHDATPERAASSLRRKLPKRSEM